MTVCILWFRQDLRLADNPALAAAARTGLRILPVYIHDPGNAGDWYPGAASRAWLHRSLTTLDASLHRSLRVYQGDASAILPSLAAKTGVRAVFWNRCYEPWRIRRDQRIKETLVERGLQVGSFNASLLWEPWETLKGDGTPYRVFTPFYRKGCLTAASPPVPAPVPNDLTFLPREENDGLPEHADFLLPPPGEPRWDVSLLADWQTGEAGAQKQLHTFLSNRFKGYKDGRNYPARPHVSRLSPHLHFGEISPRQLWHEAEACAAAGGLESDLDCFRSELGWREFSHSLLYHNPEMPESPLQKRFARFPWVENPDHLTRWQKGQTGYPLIDAGMRELWATGYMHNRVRMAVGSFLVKHLRLHWRHGEDWFWNTLADADLANNAASWQWIAGCGADAAPYFRIFNPVTQGEKFDPDGTYIRRWCPELAHLPNTAIHKPWEAGAAAPIVDHKQARDSALAALKTCS